MFPGEMREAAIRMQKIVLPRDYLVDALTISLFMAGHAVTQSCYVSSILLYLLVPSFWLWDDPWEWGAAPTR